MLKQQAIVRERNRYWLAAKLFYKKNILLCHVVCIQTKTQKQRGA